MGAKIALIAGVFVATAVSAEAAYLELTCTGKLFSPPNNEMPLQLRISLNIADRRVFVEAPAAFPSQPLGMISLMLKSADATSYAFETLDQSMIYPNLKTAGGILSRTTGDLSLALADTNPMKMIGAKCSVLQPKF